MGKKISKRERHIMETMGIDLSTVKAVSEIGRISGTHKYDVWIGREVSRNKDLVDRIADFQFVVDWAKKEKPDIFSLSFEEAYRLSDEWHKNIKFVLKNRIFEDDKDESRIIYRCNDGKHFFLLLKASDLDSEGNIMRNCVGSYKNKVSAGRSLIISLRDNKNQPHVTIEVDVQTSTVTQVRGKANAVPTEEYMKLITEFAFFASGYDEELDNELLELINLKFD